MHDWKNLRRLYNFGISRKQLALIRRHSFALLPSVNQQEENAKSDQKNEPVKMPPSSNTFEIGKKSRTHSEPVISHEECTSLTNTTSQSSTEDFHVSHSCANIEYTDGRFTSFKKFNSFEFTEHTNEVSFSCGGSKLVKQVNNKIKRSKSHSYFKKHGDFDNDGFSLDRDQIRPPDEARLWKVTSLYELDEYFTRRVFGFESPSELYKWTSCVDLMFNITDLPMLIVNTQDDPLVDCVDTNVLDVPMKYIGKVE